MPLQVHILRRILQNMLFCPVGAVFKDKGNEPLSQLRCQFPFQGHQGSYGYWAAQPLASPKGEGDRMSGGGVGSMGLAPE